MARIAVVHPDFSVRGGAEAVSMNVLEALQTDHEVTLFTATRPDFEALNAYYDAAVEDVTVSVPTINSTARRVLGPRLGLLKYALLDRAVRRKADAFDLVVGTYNELAAGDPRVLYVHHPVYRQPEESLDAREATLARRAYRRVCAAVAGANPERLRSGTAFANSRWMADLVEREYRIETRPLYPPVAAGEFDPVPLDEQERGFVSIGRFAPDKNVLRNVEIVARVRERGHDVHLHLVGPSHKSDYYGRVKRTAARYDFVHLEEELPREELTRLVETHRYGLHGKENEHFGMVVAEMLAGGTVPFVPNSGGQREIVDGRPELLYDSVDEAVDGIDAVLSDPSLEAAVRDDLPSAGERFGRARFRAHVRDVATELTR